MCCATIPSVRCSPPVRGGAGGAGHGASHLRRGTGHQSTVGFSSTPTPIHAWVGWTMCSVGPECTAGTTVPSRRSGTTTLAASRLCGTAFPGTGPSAPLLRLRRVSLLLPEDRVAPDALGIVDPIKVEAYDPPAVGGCAMYGTRSGGQLDHRDQSAWQRKRRCLRSLRPSQASSVALKALRVATTSRVSGAS